MKYLIYCSYLLVFFGLIISCSNNPTKIDSRPLVVFPAPPDTTRVQFLTTINSSTDITGSRSGFIKFILGEEKPKQIIKPYGIVVRKDKIYVTDSKQGCIDIINLKEKSFSSFSPEGFGAFKKPMNCFVDENNYLFVTDIDRKDIIVFDNKLKFIKSFGFGIITKPTDVFVYNNKIYVTDLKDSKVHVFSRDSFNLISSFPDVSSEDTAFLHQPTNIYIANDIIYVTDFGEFHIKKYDLDGKFLGVVGTYGEGTGQFARPKGIAVDKNDNLFVVDAAFENVQIFNSQGQLLTFFGGAYKGQGYLYMPIRIAIDYENLDYFRQYVDMSLRLKFLIFVTNQFGPDKITVYGFVEPK